MRNKFFIFAHSVSLLPLHRHALAEDAVRSRTRPLIRTVEDACPYNYVGCISIKGGDFSHPPRAVILERVGGLAGRGNVLPDPYFGGGEVIPDHYNGPSGTPVPTIIGFVLFLKSKVINNHSSRAPVLTAIIINPPRRGKPSLCQGMAVRRIWKIMAE